MPWTACRLDPALLDALRFVAYPDAARSLGCVRDSFPGVRVLAVSNWDAGLAGVLQEVGLLSLLDGVVSSAQVGAAKPDPAIFRAALARAGVAAAHAVHVGDSPAEDVLGARAVGIRAVLLHRDPAAPVPGGLPPDTEVIASLAALLSSPR